MRSPCSRVTYLSRGGRRRRGTGVTSLVSAPSKATFPSGQLQRSCNATEAETRYSESESKQRQETNDKTECQANKERRESVQCRVARGRDREMLSDRECLTYCSTCRARVSTQAGALPCAPSRPPERTHAHGGRPGQNAVSKVQPMFARVTYI